MIQIHTRIRRLVASPSIVCRCLSVSPVPATTAGKKRKWSVDRITGLVTSTSSDPNGDGDANTTASPTYQTIIGLEIHARLTACPTRLFSSSPNGAALSTSPAPNQLTSPFDLAHPGTLPRLSKTAVQHALLSTAALNCTINPVSRFERKHYFWHDLPHGYQITQQRWPIGGEGTLRVERGDGSGGGGADTKTKKKGGKQNRNDESYFDVGIDRIQLEIDTAKTTKSSSTSAGLSLINLNRAGAPLIEIVFAPTCLLYTSPSPRDRQKSRMPSSA